MPFNPGIEPGTKIDNNKLVSIFKCSPQGGMRRSHKTDTLVLVSNKTKPFYVDEWKDDIIHYTGMGQTGDQSLDFMQNRTLKESKINGIDVHYFEVYNNKEYTYIGRVKLVNEPYNTTQRDYEGNERRVWIFPLKVIDGNSKRIDIETHLENQLLRENLLRKKSTSELLESIKNKLPGKREVTSYEFERDPAIVVLAKRRAQGFCQLCGEQAPFASVDGVPYLEIHHIKWLSEGGVDSLDNTVALCPNCHRKMHILNLEEDVSSLKKKAQEIVT